MSTSTLPDPSRGALLDPGAPALLLPTILVERLIAMTIGAYDLTAKCDGSWVVESSYQSKRVYFCGSLDQCLTWVEAALDSPKQA